MTRTKLHFTTSLLFAFFAMIAISPPLTARSEINWIRLSSATGDLPTPGTSRQQTGALIADFDKDGTNDFVLSFREKAPALVWYRRMRERWERYVMENEYLTVEAGGAVYDIDADGDLDLVFGGDWQSKAIWWWENPYPAYDPTKTWKRRTIKDGGSTQHHDQIFGNFRGVDHGELAFWNQGAKSIFLATIPKDPQRPGPWELTRIFSGKAGEQTAKYAEGMAAADIDGDGKVDLLAGNSWFKHRQGSDFVPIQIGEAGGRIAVGRFKLSKFPQIVIAPGDGTGLLRWYECEEDPLKPAGWRAHDLLSRPVIHGHSLEVGDVDRDGALDIFCAEMAKWTENRGDPDNAQAKAWIFYGDGQGRFRTTELATGMGFHEARLGDLDGDGDLDILNKPYNWETPRVDVWLNNGTGSAQDK